MISAPNKVRLNRWNCKVMTESRQIAMVIYSTLLCGPIGPPSRTLNKLLQGDIKLSDNGIMMK